MFLPPLPRLPLTLPACTGTVKFNSIGTLLSGLELTRHSPTVLCPARVRSRGFEGGRGSGGLWEAVGAAVVGAAAAETACKPLIMSTTQQTWSRAFSILLQNDDVFLLAFLLLQIGTFTVLVLVGVEVFVCVSRPSNVSSCDVCVCVCVFNRTRPSATHHSVRLKVRLPPPPRQLITHPSPDKIKLYSIDAQF